MTMKSAVLTGVDLPSKMIGWRIVVDNESESRLCAFARGSPDFDFMWLPREKTGGHSSVCRKHTNFVSLSISRKGSMPRFYAALLLASVGAVRNRRTQNKKGSQGCLSLMRETSYFALLADAFVLGAGTGAATTGFSAERV